jgi:hypothetical protein
MSHQRQNITDPGVQVFLRADPENTPGPAPPPGAAPDGAQELPAKDGIDLARTKRVIRHLTSPDLEDRQKAFKQGTTAIYVYLCDLLEIDHSQVDMRRKDTKRQLLETLRQVVCFSVVQSHASTHGWPRSTKTEKSSTDSWAFFPSNLRIVLFLERKLWKLSGRI